MRVVAWNVGHQTQERRLKPGFEDAVSKLKPDVLVLNEYVHGPSRQSLVDFLAWEGFAAPLVSDRMGTHNQVLIAGRQPVWRGDLQGPPTDGDGGASNFLHVVLRSAQLAIVGLRVPAYDKPVLVPYWQELGALIRSTSERRIMFIGDFNADPETPSYVGSPVLRALRSEGWHLPSPTGPWSYCSGTRIDHVLLANGLRTRDVRYVTEVDGTILASTESANRVSDHAALVVDVEI